ncbi:MAG: hypothetical protein V2A73_12425 [Pseudomonadota bacterium]
MAEDWRREWQNAVRDAEFVKRDSQIAPGSWPAYGVSVGWRTVLAADEALRGAELGRDWRKRIVDSLVEWAEAECKEWVSRNADRY